ncbi:MAG TPA: hypothetical protein ENL06_02235 [Candidatus Portnoybacteria bacterium]|nr:hypothetical protein [Candidatus Portnoybacteria bacterium]
MEIPFIIQFVTAIVLIILWFTILIVGFVNSLKYNKNLIKIYDYLRKNHPQKWEELGKQSFPTSYFNPSSARYTFKILKFIKSPDNLNDPELTELKLRTRKYLYISLVCLMLNAISFILILLLAKIV